MWEQQFNSMIEENSFSREAMDDLSVTYTTETDDSSFLADGMALLGLFILLPVRDVLAYRSGISWVPYDSSCSFSGANHLDGNHDRYASYSETGWRMIFTDGGASAGYRCTSKSTSMAQIDTDRGWV